MRRQALVTSASVIVLSAGTVGCGVVDDWGGGPVTRADSIAVISTALAPHFKGDEVLHFAPDTEPLVLSAARDIAAGRVRRTSSRVFCTADVAPADAAVGSLISLSLEPGDGPARPPGGAWAPAFYVANDLAFVAVSSSCWRSTDRGGSTNELPDGRLVSSLSGGATVELRRERDGWRIARYLNRWIT